MSESVLQPISYRGLTNMFQQISGWREMDLAPLAAKPIAAVETAEDGGLLVFRLVDGRTLTYRAEGDCCSESWIEHLTVPPDITGAEATGWTEREMGEFEDGHSTVRVYQTSFTTTKGEIIVEYRNSSNGYYGGWLSGPEEQWALDEIDRFRKQKS